MPKRMRPELASLDGLNRSGIGGTANEVVTLLLHSAVVAEVISALAFQNKWLRKQQQMNETPAPRFHSAVIKKQQRQGIVKKQPIVQDVNIKDMRR